MKYLSERRGTSYNDFDVTLCHCKSESKLIESFWISSIWSSDWFILLKEFSIIFVVGIDADCCG